MPRLALVAVLALASMSLAQTPTADPAVAHQQIHEALSDWAKMNSAEKAAAIDKVVGVGGTAAAHALADKLHDKEPEVRKALAGALGKLKDEKSVPALARALAVDANDKHGDVDAFAAICKALGDIGDAHAIEPLVHGLLSGDRRHKDWRTRGNARIQALGKIKDKDAIDQLLDIWVRGTNGTSSRSIRSNSQPPSNPFESLIVQGLQNLTGEKLTDQKAWHEWWKKHQAHFEFEKPKEVKTAKVAKTAKTSGVVRS